MGKAYGRRDFLARGGATAAGAALLGSTGVLAACGGSGGKASSSGGGGGNTGPSSAGIGRGTPKRGGTLTIGVEAEDNGFNPTIASWDVSGLIYGSCLYDTITAIDVNGQAQPYLVQSVTPNADYTQWTLKLRSTPITFHDGSGLDSSAVVGSMEAYVHSPQNGLGLTNIDSIRNPDATTVVIACKEPWIALPFYLSTMVVMAPAMLKAQNGGNLAPVGSGPFVFKEWVPNDHLTVTRNPNYWQSNLPYLDSIVFHPIPDHQSRENSLRAGSVDIIHSNDTQTITDLRNNSSFQFIWDRDNAAGEHEQSFFMINTAQPPLDDVRVRQAMAYAIDRSKVVSIELNNLPFVSSGPFARNSPYYTDTGYPSYNLAKAQALVKAYQADKGPINVQISTINDAKDLAITELVQGMLKTAGITTQIVQVQQSQYISQALLGQYSVRQWRQFSASDPDQNYVWWSSTTAGPVGKLALNFARNKDPEIDAALETGRTHPDPATRVQAYQTISKRFGADVPYLWLSQTIWSVIAKPKVQNFNNPVFPDGTTKGLPMTAGYFSPRYIWLS